MSTTATVPDTSAPDVEPERDARAWQRPALGYVLLALLAYVPPLATAPGKIGADTKQYLYLDPGRLFAGSTSMWDPNVGMGTVTHQTIGYAFPMAPYYWIFDKLGVPDWVAQRLWLGSLFFFAAVGVLYLVRTFGIRGPGVVVAALAYMLTPYVLDYSARISVLLMPWAALPWMIALIRKALRDGPDGGKRIGWRYPAIFALVVQVVGGVNATALIFAGIAPVLWILYAWLIARDVPFGRAWGVTWRTGLLTGLTSLWWISGLRMQGAYGLNILKYTETVDAVARTSTPNEVLRGLGYWFFYGQDRLGSWIEAARDYTQHEYIILAGYGLVVLGLAAIAFTRWRHRAYFVALLLIGVVIGVGAHPYDSPTPLGALFKAFATGSTAGLALRSTGRAIPLVVLALAVILGLAANAAYRRLHARGRRVVAWTVPLAIGGLVVLNFPALYDGTLYGKNLQRNEQLPTYWTQAISQLDHGNHLTRILEEPGSDFASYTWGNTVDPITPGLTDRPYVARELIPYGTAGSADLLNAIDRRLQEGVADPNSLVALWRRMGVGDVVARNDIQYERYDLVRPTDLAGVLAATPGLGAPQGYGPASTFAQPPGYLDELTLEDPPSPAPVAPVVIYPVSDPTQIVRAESPQQGLMVSGDGEGLVDAAGVGLLNGAGVIRYSASYTTPEALRNAVGTGDVLVITDNNRLRARRWTSVKDNLGYTEEAGGADAPLTTDLGDARLDVFPGEQPSALTTTNDVGVQRIVATAYGNTITYTPEDRAARALDGDPQTAWRTQAFGDARGQRIEIDLNANITTDHVRLLQPINGGRNRFVTNAVLTFDGGHPVPVTLGPQSRAVPGQTFTFPRRTFHTFTIRITQTNDHRVNLFGQADAVGFAEIGLRDEHATHDVRLVEYEQMPRDLVDALGASSAAHPLVFVMARDAVRPVPPRTQPELSIARDITLPTARTFTVTGNATIASDARAVAMEQALGIPDAAHGGITATSSEFLPGCLACRADAAIDGDPNTAWQTPFVGVRGQGIEFDTARPISFDHMDVRLLADGRHSVPTHLQLDVDGQIRDLLPAVIDSSTPNASALVHLTFPRVTGRHIIIRIVDVRGELARSFGTAATRLEPAGIAEVGIPGLRPAAAPTRIDSGCRSDLLRVDGRPYPVRVSGPAADASKVMGLDVTPCGPALTLTAGPHVIVTARGKDAGFSIDRLVFASGTNNVAVKSNDGHVALTSATPTTPPPAITVTHDGRTTMRVHVTQATAPFWLVLGESHSAGWHATVKGGGSLGAPALVDGYANGWFVRPPASGTLDVTMEWVPQRQVRAAIGISLLTGLACIAIIAFTWWRRRRILAALTAPFPGDAAADLGWEPRGAELPLPRRARWLAPLIAGLLGALVVAPWVGALVAIVVALVLWRPSWRFVVMAVPATLLGICGLYIAIEQYRYNYPSVFEWPTVFPRARTLAWIAVMLLVADVVVEVLRTWRATPGPEIDLEAEAPAS